MFSYVYLIVLVELLAQSTFAVTTHQSTTTHGMTSTALSTSEPTTTQRETTISQMESTPDTGQSTTGLASSTHQSTTTHGMTSTALISSEPTTTQRETTISQMGSTTDTGQSTTGLASSTHQSTTTHGMTSTALISSEPTTTQRETTISQMGSTPDTGQSTTGLASSTHQSTTTHGMTSTPLSTSEPTTTKEGTTTSQMGPPINTSQTTTAHASSTHQSATTYGMTSMSSTGPPTTQQKASTSQIEPTTETDQVQTQAIPSLCSSTGEQTSEIQCGNGSSLSIQPGKLSDESKTELVSFLKAVGSLSDQLTSSQAEEVTKDVLQVFTVLTNPEQDLALQEERDVIAETENAMNAMAGTLVSGDSLQKTYQGNSVILSKSPPMGKIVISSDGEDESGGDTPQETVQINPSQLHQDEGDAGLNVVLLRRANSSKTIDEDTIDEPEGRTSEGTGFRLNSALLDISIFREKERLSMPVTFSLFQKTTSANEQNTGNTATEQRETPLCVFESVLDDQVYWSSWGCVVEQNTSLYTNCSCNHTTTFAVLMQVKEFEVSDANSKAMTWITYIGCTTSIISLLIELAVFIYLRRMLKFDRSFIHGNLSAAVIVAQILFISGIDSTENRGVCKAVAFLLHFTYLSVFAWMLVEGVHLYRKIIKVYGSENIKMYPYLIVGWGVPLAIVLISFGAGFDYYGAGKSCWLDIESGLIWAFVGPALLVVLINTAVLAMVIRVIIKSAELGKEKKHDHIRAGIKGAIMLIPILGLTWVFGILAVDSSTIVFQYLFTIFNSFQGLFIFLINCVFNSEVRAAFIRKREKENLMSNTTDMSMSISVPTKISEVDTTDTRGRLDCGDAEPRPDNLVPAPCNSIQNNMNQCSMGAVTRLPGVENPYETI